MTTVYQFQSYDITNDRIVVSKRWATVEAIEHVCGERIGKVVEVDDSLVGAEIPGMTAIGFNPFLRETGFQRTVR
ncbi:MAG TPA: hypothetical protein VK700_09890 [Steroidobacteraceae bacterium]|jgi:hypothetical protein|nr:hypothetical protein [Steroidobacteraceae bacterium]